MSPLPRHFAPAFFLPCSLVEVVLDCILQSSAVSEMLSEEDEVQEAEARAWAERVVDATLYGSPQELSALRQLVPPWAEEYYIAEAGNDLLVAAAQVGRQC